MPYSIDEILKAYEILVNGIESDASDDDERAYGGIIRAGKGKLVESIARHMVEIAWNNIGGDPNRLSLEKQTLKIPINKPYIEKLKHKQVRNYIYRNFMSIIMDLEQMYMYRLIIKWLWELNVRHTLKMQC
jgi:hypothetical protein